MCFATYHKKGCPEDKHSWIGDGACDDVTNTIECNYDGNDCCDDNPRTIYCYECICFDMGMCLSLDEVDTVSYYYMFLAEEETVLLPNELNYTGNKFPQSFFIRYKCGLVHFELMDIFSIKIPLVMF